MRRKLENIFSWSKSRHEKFAGCERAYFYHYYLSWGGWEREAPARAKQAYALKKLTNRYAWAGTAVHEGIRESVLKWMAGHSVDEEALIASIHTRMRQEFRASREGLCRELFPKSFWGLVEHANGVELEKEAWRSNWETVESALRHFMSSTWPATLKALGPGRLLEADSKDFESSFFELDGTRLFAMPDLAFLGEGGELEIVDWKTGSPHEGNVEQVVGYALFMEARHGHSALGTRVRLIYLNQQVEEAHVIDEAALESFKRFFQSSVLEMKGKLKEVSSNTALEEPHFLKTDSPAKCTLCPFLKMCEPV